jgi:uncharacterized protein YbaA (DUF1428 family)
MANYVDGFVVPLPKKNLAKYRKAIKIAAKVFLEHGALEYVECMADDVPDGKKTSFPMAVKLEKGEIVCFSWAVYKNRKHRDAAMKKVMADERLQGPDCMPFDASRMIFGGFEQLISVKAKAKTKTKTKAKAKKR